ncbi:MAG: hypothetical protein AB1552_05430 [Nitrospirota bacterium]
MSEGNKKLQTISDELKEHLIAVKGALELLDASQSDTEMSDLILKSMHRMDALQKLTDEMVQALRHCFAKIEELKTSGNVPKNG